MRRKTSRDIYDACRSYKYNLLALSTKDHTMPDSTAGSTNFTFAKPGLPASATKQATKLTSEAYSAALTKVGGVEEKLSDHTTRNTRAWRQTVTELMKAFASRENNERVIQESQALSDLERDLLNFEVTTEVDFDENTSIYTVKVTLTGQAEADDESELAGPSKYL
jgi:hypothetical protein